MLRRRPTTVALLALVASLAGVACSGGGSDSRSSGADDPSRGPVETSDVAVPGEAATPLDAIEGREWVLDAAESSVEVDASRPVTLSVSLGEVIGSAGCNTYQGPVEIGEGSWAAGPFTLTQSTCEDAVMASEARVLEALGSVDAVTVTAERLVLSGPDGLELAFGTASPVDELTPGTLVGRWLVVAVGDASSGQAPLEGTDPLLVIEGSGALGGVLGCNTLSGTWRLEAEQLMLSDVTADDVVCDRPEGIGAQEAAIVDALRRTTTYAYEGGDGLTLRAEDGTPLLALRRAP